MFWVDPNARTNPSTPGLLLKECNEGGWGDALDPLRRVRPAWLRLSEMWGPSQV